MNSDEEAEALAREERRRREATDDDHSPTIPDLRGHPRDLRSREPILPISYRVMWTPPPPPRDTTPTVKPRGPVVACVALMMAVMLMMFVAIAAKHTAGVVVCDVIALGIFVVAARFST